MKVENQSIKKTDENTVNSKEKKKKNLSVINMEKGVLVYQALAEKYSQNRGLIKYGAFSDLWDEMFTEKWLHDPREIKLQGFKECHNILDPKSLEEIHEYRNSFSIYDGLDVPEDIKVLAKEKDVIVSLAENRNKQLSGFDISVKLEKIKSERIITVPFSLTEKEVRKRLSNMPTRAEVVDMERKMLDLLRNNSQADKNKVRAVHKYHAPYATHEFKVAMNKFTIKQCVDKELTNACCLLCNRLRINNLSNNAPIVYRFCKGSGQRKRNIKRINNRRKNSKQKSEVTAKA